MSDSHDQSLDSLTINTLTVDALMVEIHSRLADQTARLMPLEDVSKDTLLTDYAPVYAASLVEMNETF